MDQQAEIELFDKLTKLVVTGKAGEICSEIGKFIEAVIIHECTKTTAKKPKNTKEAIDTLAKEEVISSTLAAKLHVVRTLRNAHIHELTNKTLQTSHLYQPTKADARFSAEILNEFLSWMYEEKITVEWNHITKQFARCEQLLGKGDNTVFIVVGEAYAALRHALELKMRSLGLKPQNDLASGIEVLLRHGVDVRSEAWKRLAVMRMHAVHGSPQQYNALRQSWPSFATEMLPDLRQVLSKLNPLDHSKRNDLNCPRVPSEVFKGLAS
jgi:uncharacterized protein DUF4145